MTKLRPLAKRQHYHMAFILKKFTNKGKLLIVDPKSREETPTTVDDPIFFGVKAWSNHIEEVLGRDDIERKMVGQVKHILNYGNVTDHDAVSRYDLFWKLRQHHAINPSNPEILFKEMTGGKVNSELVHWANQHNKVVVNGDGTVDGIFCSSMKIENEQQENWSQYEGVKWNVLHSPSGGFISADCYHQAIIPITPTTVLVAVPPQHHLKRKEVIQRDTVEELNALALEQCSSFCFKMGLG